MGYVENNLNPGERILYATQLHWIVLMRSIVVDAIFSGGGIALLVWAAAGKHPERGEAQMIGMVAVALILFGNLILALAWVSRSATEMAVTNKRVIIKVGFLTKRTIELFLSRWRASKSNRLSLDACWAMAASPCAAPAAPTNRSATSPIPWSSAARCSTRSNNTPRPERSSLTF